ncbi:MAG: hypothetical protein ACI8XO_004825, partial [Verrucomicrobiales bacterium]
ALASNSNSPLSSLKSALVLAKIPAHLCMTYFLTTPKAGTLARRAAANASENGQECPFYNRIKGAGDIKVLPNSGKFSHDPLKLRCFFWGRFAINCGNY